MRITLLLLILVAIPATAVELTRDGKPLAVIVHNGHTALPPEMAKARGSRHLKPPAETLQDYLKQITGADLPLVAAAKDAAGKPMLVLSVVKEVPGASKTDTGTQAYRIKADGKMLTITAASALGLQNAVYGFLEDHLGCRFYSFRRKGLSYAGTGFEVVPKQPTLKLDGINDFQEPAFPNRGIIYWVGSYPYIAKNRGIGTPAGGTSGAVSAHHNMYHLIPPKDKTHRGKTTKGLFKDHPGFYPMHKDGKRRPTWAMGICGTNKDLPTFLAAALEKSIQTRIKRGKGKIDWNMPFSAAQGDGFSGCHCPDCRKLVHAEQSEAAPTILALNRTLEILNKKYPKARVITFAYFSTIAAPNNLKPHKNLMINVVSSDAGQNAAGDQMGLINGNPANRDYARALKEWPKVAPNRVTVWHWDTYRAEWPSMFYVAPNMRYFRDCKIYAVNPQFCGGPWLDMLAWLYLKLAWNPDLDGDKLIRQYVDDNFGKEAGKHVYDYLKLAQSGYEKNLYLPSAVRWSGWTATMRVKMWPPALLAKMSATMDQAMAAAEKAGDKTRLANLIGARGKSVDVLILNEIGYQGKPWGPVPFQGRNWFVSGADPRVPPALMRAKQGIVMNGGGEHGILRAITRYTRGNGGPLVELAGAKITAAVCPDLKGQITSVVDKTSGKDLLSVQGANVGYMDLFPRVKVQAWLPVKENNNVARRANDDWSATWSKFQNPTKDSLQTDLVLSPAVWGFYPNQYLRRTVTVTDQGMKVERQFIQKKSRTTLKNPWRFTTRWLLALPHSKYSKVIVKGGGVDQMLDLRYAVPGGIKTVKAGEKMPAADWMDEQIDAVIAISDAKATKLALKGDGEVRIQLDRGDGVAAVITTPVAGWDSVEIKPVVDKQYLEVKLVGKPQPMDATKENEIELPTQMLSAVAVPATAKPAEHETVAAAPRTVKIKKTGDNTAINEIDGAELIWIPAGEFVRGSDKYADEMPKKKVHLDGYWIYKYPVTLGQYKKFCEAAGQAFKPMWGQGMHAAEGKDADFAVQTNWYEADKYAKWAGGALPTEAQWEKAARGTDGREFPWGNKWDATKCASYEATIGKFTPGFVPVQAKPEGASPFGVEQMAGNVWEWVNDWYQYDYYKEAPAKNPNGPAKGSHKVIRGGCSVIDERFSRTSARMIQPPQVRDWTPIGFRLVVNADKNGKPRLQ